MRTITLEELNTRADTLKIDQLAVESLIYDLLAYATELTSRLEWQQHLTLEARRRYGELAGTEWAKFLMQPGSEARLARGAVERLGWDPGELWPDTCSPNPHQPEP